MHFSTKLCKVNSPSFVALASPVSSISHLWLEPSIFEGTKAANGWGHWATPFQVLVTEEKPLVRRSLWRVWKGLVPYRYQVIDFHNHSLHWGKKTCRQDTGVFLSLCVCVVPDLHAHTFTPCRGQFLSLSVTSVNMLYVLSTSYDLLFFRHMHRQSRILLIPALCMFAQQGGNILNAYAKINMIITHAIVKEIIQKWDQ